MCEPPKTAFLLAAHERLTLELMQSSLVRIGCDRIPRSSGQGSHCSSWQLLSDSDGDGIGDSCDLCPTQQGSVMQCAYDADCPPTQGGPGRCIAEVWYPDMYLPLGRCAAEADGDGDGWGDACDTCPSTRDGPDALNSNEVSELLNGQSTQGDACDEAPQALMAVVTPEALHVLLPPVQQELDANGPLQITEIEVKSLLGKSDPADPPQIYTAPVGFRFCDCRNGSNLDELGRSVDPVDVVVDVDFDGRRNRFVTSAKHI